ncbi:hypothetical protein ILUMI_02832, partial [Ignelater luminosus]
MNTTTLRGIFPEPKPVYKRNFIKENVKHIKQMQGILQNSGLFDAKPARNKPMKAMSQYKPPPNNLSNRPLSQTRSLPIPKLQRVGKRKPAESEKGKHESEQLKPAISPIEESVEKHTHRAIQTEKPEDISKLYENGIIKYPSAAVLKMIASKQNPTRRRERSAQQARATPNQDHGDTGGIVVSNPHNDLSDGMQALDINDKHNFIKENILALKQKAPKSEVNNQNPLQNYQKGVLPKYLRERKEEQKKELEGDTDCPEGHVLLPEEERKETLRVLRQ